MLEAGEPAGEQRQHRRLVEGGIGAHYHRHRDLAPVRVGPAHHHRIPDAGILPQHRLQLGGIDVLAAGDHHVLLAVDDPEIAVLVEPADVAGAEPAVEEGLAGGGLIRPVLIHHIGT